MPAKSECPGGFNVDQSIVDEETLRRSGACDLAAMAKDPRIRFGETQVARQELELEVPQFWMVRSNDLEVVAIDVGQEREPVAF
jgi:hypothetical protein